MVVNRTGFAAAFKDTTAKGALLVTDGAEETILANDAVIIFDDLTAAIGAANFV